jgi:hypothetical protein
MFDSYITKEWYRGTYPCTNTFQAGEIPTDAENAELDRAIFKACRVIDKVTFHRSTLFDEVQDDGITYVLTDDERTAIMYAVGAQVDYIAGIGYNPQDMTSADYGGGFTIGKYSESAKGDTRMQDVVSQEALDYLRIANLTKNGFKDHSGALLRWW